MDTQSLRNAIINTPRKQEDLPTPFWPGTDGSIAMIDIPTDVVSSLRQELITKQNDSLAYTCALICVALINKETGDLIFEATDRDTVKHLGSSVTAPIARALQSFLGLNAKEAVEVAKND